MCRVKKVRKIEQNIYNVFFLHVDDKSVSCGPDRAHQDTGINMDKTGTQENPWDRQPLPPIQDKAGLESDQDNSDKNTEMDKEVSDEIIKKVIIINGEERLLGIASDTRSAYRREISTDKKEDEDTSNEDEIKKSDKFIQPYSQSPSLYDESHSASPTPSMESNHESNGESPLPLHEIISKYDDKRTELEETMIEDVENKHDSKQDIHSEMDVEFPLHGIDKNENMIGDSSDDNLIEYYVSVSEDSEDTKNQDSNLEKDNITEKLDNRTTVVVHDNVESKAETDVKLKMDNEDEEEAEL